MEIPKKQELQQIGFNHSSDIDSKDLMNLYKKYTAKPYSFLVFNTIIKEIPWNENRDKIISNGNLIYLYQAKEITKNVYNNILYLLKHLILIDYLINILLYKILAYTTHGKI